MKADEKENARIFCVGGELKFGLVKGDIHLMSGHNNPSIRCHREEASMNSGTQNTQTLRPLTGSCHGLIFINIFLRKYFLTPMLELQEMNFRNFAIYIHTRPFSK